VRGCGSHARSRRDFRRSAGPQDLARRGWSPRLRVEVEGGTEPGRRGGKQGKTTAAALLTRLYQMLRRARASTAKKAR
jgi:hypothetical protein